jgi:uncharacterized repeat protein (TIGR01451 family)
MADKRRQNSGRLQLRLLLVGVVAFLLFVGLASPTVAFTPLPRPTLEPGSPGGGGGGGGGGGVGGGGDGEGPVPPKSSVVHGTVLNWGFGGQPRANLHLGDGGWQLSTTSDDNGYYIFGNLGAGVTELRLLLAPGDTFTIALRDIPIRLTGTNEVIANLPVYTGEQLPQSPVRLKMTVSPAQARPGSKVKYTISLENGLPNGISHVIISDMLPQGLGSIEATTTRGSVDVLERLVTADIGEAAKGAVETVEIVAVIDPRIGAATPLENYATLLYAESIAAQASADLVITNRPVAAAQATSTPLPTRPPAATATPAPAAISVPATASPTAEVPMGTPVVPAALPVTGGEFLPFTSLALALLVFLAHRLRSRPD